jgi:LPXTG-site transpeptidase (sortase) family protein
VRTHRGITEYRVTSTRVAHETDPEVLRETGGTRLTLITCYPFSGLLRSPWRWVVTCDAVEGGKMPA